MTAVDLDVHAGAAVPSAWQVLDVRPSDFLPLPERLTGHVEWGSYALGDRVGEGVPSTLLLRVIGRAHYRLALGLTGPVRPAKGGPQRST
jgi:hypothetical protein